MTSKDETYVQTNVSEMETREGIESKWSWGLDELGA